MTQPPQSPFPPPDPHSGQPHDPYGAPPPSSGAPYHPGPVQDPHSVPGPPPEPPTAPPYDPNATPGPPSGPPYDPNATPGPPPGPPYDPNTGFPPAPGQPFNHTPPPSKRSNGPIIIGIAIGAVALVCLAAAFFVVFVPSSGDDSANSNGSSGEESGDEAGDVDDSITGEFDPDNATFWDTYDGIAQEKLALEDGRFYPGEASDDARHTKASAEPVYSDVDLDGDLDVAMTLQDTGEPGEDEAWSSIHIWLWEDGDIIPVKEHASWQWDCVGSSFEVTPGAGEEYFSVTRDAYNICEDPESETITITVEDETPVQLSGEHRGATETCWVSEGTAHYADLAGVSEPTLLPKADAPALGDSSQQTKVEVAVEDWDSESFGGYVIVVVTWDDGEETCGWVPWETYKDNA